MHDRQGLRLVGLRHELGLVARVVARWVVIVVRDVTMATMSIYIHTVLIGLV